MSKVFFVLLVASFLFISIAHSQSEVRQIDSIKRVLPTTSGEKKADLFLKLCKIYLQTNMDSAIVYATKANVLSAELNYSSGAANSMLQLGIACDNTKDPTKSREYYMRALRLFEEIGDKKGQANVCNQLGNSFMVWGDYKTAMKYHTLALVLRAQIGDKRGLAASYNNIGNTYAAEASFYLAVDNHLKGISLTEELNDTSINGRGRLGMSYFNVARLYLVTEDVKRAEEFLDKAQKLFDETDNLYGLAYIYAAKAAIEEKRSESEKAILFYSRAIELTKKLGSDGELADNYTRIAFVYYNMALKSGTVAKSSKQNKNYEIAFNYTNLALDICKNLNYEQGIVTCYVLLGNIYREWGDYDNSQNNYNIAAKHRLIPANKIVLYEGLYLLKAKQQKYKEALENYMLYTHLKDSVYNTQNTLKNASLGQAYVENQKEKERDLTNKMKELAHEEEIKRQRVIQLFTLIGLFIVAVFAFFVFRSYRQKQKANIIITKQKAEVESAYKIIEEQKKIVDQHNKDVTDSINYAKRIQTALLASDSLLKKNLPEYFVLYKPKDIVSGDFYWASELTDKNTKKFILCSGDCTGHGVPGAFMSLLNITKLNETVNEKKRTDPAHILNTVREEIIKALNPENATEECNDGMDCTLCIMELAEKQEVVFGGDGNALRGTLSYSAANNPFYLIRNKQLIVGNADKIPVGKSLKEKEPFTSHTVELLKGDVIYLLTDGYADQFGGKNGKKFKYKTLEDLLLTCHQSPLSEQKRLLDSTIEQWKGANEQVDDILIIGIRIS